MSHELNRRAILAGAASLPATALPVIAAPGAPDPIFAKIAARREGLQALELALKEKARLELALPRERRWADDPSWIASERAIAAIYESMDTWGLLETIPTTLEGLRALVHYVLECEAAGDDVTQTYMDDDEGWGDGRRCDAPAVPPLLNTIATSLDRLSRS